MCTKHRPWVFCKKERWDAISNFYTLPTITVVRMSTSLTWPDHIHRQAEPTEGCMAHTWCVNMRGLTTFAGRSTSSYLRPLQCDMYNLVIFAWQHETKGLTLYERKSKRFPIDFSLSRAFDFGIFSQKFHDKPSPLRTTVSNIDKI